MASWQLQEAKARLSEVIDHSSKGPQIITRRGVQTAVVVSFADWQKLQGKILENAASRPAGALSTEEKKKSEAFLKILQSGPEFQIPARGKMRMRRPVQF